MIPLLVQSTKTAPEIADRAVSEDSVAFSDGGGGEDCANLFPVRQREPASSDGGPGLGLDQQRGVSLPALNGQRLQNVAQASGPSPYRETARA